VAPELRAAIEQGVARATAHTVLLEFVGPQMILDVLAPPDP
jgi:hypothetical protein